MFGLLLQNKELYNALLLILVLYLNVSSPVLNPLMDFVQIP